MIEKTELTQNAATAEKPKKIWDGALKMVRGENTAQQITALIMAGATVIGYVLGEGLADAGNKPEDGADQ